MRTTGNVSPFCDACFDEILLNVTAHVAWRRAVERQIAAFSADDDFFATEAARSQFIQSRANRSFASLEPVICRRVNYICAQLDRAHDGLGVAPISFLVGITEISADADRRNGQPLRLTEIIRSRTLEPRAVVRRALSGGTAFRCHDDPDLVNDDCAMTIPAA